MNIPKQAHSLGELSQHIGAELKGDSDCIISGVASLDAAKPGDISFLYNLKNQKQLLTTAASALVISPELVQKSSVHLLVTKNPRLGFAKIVDLFFPKDPVKPGIHPTAIIGEGCKIATTARIGPNVVIGDHVSVGDQSVVSAGCFIGNYSTLGESCLLGNHVTVHHNIRIGNRTALHSGAVVGGDGFGMAIDDKGAWHKIPHIGAVIIGDDVEIGANTTIDRGVLDDTIIENGVKLDNQIQVGHNVHIGANTIIAGCTAIGGSTRIGKQCMIGGAVMIADHAQICDGVILTGGAGVSSSPIRKSGVYSSHFAVIPNREWLKNTARIRHLDNIVRQVQTFEERLQKLEENDQ